MYQQSISAGQLLRTFSVLQKTAGTLSFHKSLSLLGNLTCLTRVFELGVLQQQTLRVYALELYFEARAPSYGRSR
jgi:hypothetical protein